jgi:hypothetical protein
MTAETADVTLIIILCVLYLAGLLSVVVICFLKGKPVFAVLGIAQSPLWAVIGACRIAKPDSWWARKKYCPEKTTIAHRRFTRFYNQPPPPPPAAIIDDPVERALERVRRKQAVI